jgi:hypothetical protein
MSGMHRYMVTWEWTQGGPAPRRNRVLTEDGYSTVDDIPKMIGITKGIPPEEIVIIKCEEVYDGTYRREFKSL